MTIREILLTHCQFYERFRTVRLDDIDAIAREIIEEVEKIANLIPAPNGFHLHIHQQDWQRFRKENGVE